MPQRAYWSGQIRLALVSIPVEIFSAVKSSAGMSFRQIHEPSGRPVKYEKVVPGLGPVDPDEIIRGFEYERGHFVTLSEEEIAGVRLESRKTLELTQFVEQGAIEPIYFEKPYWVVPSDELAEEAFRVVRDALRASRKLGLGQLALRGRETLVALKPCGRGMLLETLRYEEEVNRAAGYFRGISDAASPPELLELATSLIERKAAPFDAGAYKDRYEEALKAIIAAKVGGRTEPADTPEPEARPSNVIDLMAALKQSLEKGGARAEAKPAAGPRPKRAAPKPAADPKPAAAKEAEAPRGRKRA